MIRLLLVDDEVSVRKGLRMQLELEPDVDVVGEAGDGETALRIAPELAPDVILMDIRMKGMDGITATRALRDSYPGAAVVVLSLQDDQATKDLASNAGARAFVGKHEAATQLITTIRKVAPAV